MPFLEALDPLDLIMGIASIFGTYIAYKGYQLSEKEFKLQCIQMGIQSKEAVQRAWESYEQYQNDTLQEKNEALSEANQILSNDEDTEQQYMEQIYNNYSLNNSYTNQYNQAVADDSSLPSMYRDLTKDAIYNRRLIRDTLAINDYTHYTQDMNAAKNADLKKEIKNTGKELANTAKQTQQAKKVVHLAKKEEKEVNDAISKKKQSKTQTHAFIHPYF